MKSIAAGTLGLVAGSTSMICRLLALLPRPALTYGVGDGSVVAELTETKQQEALHISCHAEDLDCWVGLSLLVLSPARAVLRRSRQRLRREIDSEEIGL